MRATRQLPAIVSLVVALTGTMLTSRAFASIAEATPPVAPGPPPEALNSALSHAIQLRDGGRAAEAASVLQKLLTENPNAADAHLLLANIDRDFADTMKEPARARQFETAALHYRQALDLTTESSVRSWILWSLVSSYVDGNRLAEAEKYARQVVREDATGVDAYGLLSSILRKADRADAGAAILRESRQAVAADLESQRRLGLYMWQHVQESPRLSNGNARMLLDEALLIADNVLAGNPDSEALRFKAAVLQLRATRVEQDEKRKNALTAEGDRLWEQSLERRGDETRAEDQRTAASRVP